MTRLPKSSEATVFRMGTKGNRFRPPPTEKLYHPDSLPFSPTCQFYEGLVDIDASSESITYYSYVMIRTRTKNNDNVRLGAFVTQEDGTITSSFYVV